MTDRPRGLMRWAALSPTILPEPLQLNRRMVKAACGHLGRTEPPVTSKRKLNVRCRTCYVKPHIFQMMLFLLYRDNEQSRDAYAVAVILWKLFFSCGTEPYHEELTEVRVQAATKSQLHVDCLKDMFVLLS